MNLIVLIGLIRDLTAAIKAGDWQAVFIVLGKVFAAIGEFIGGVSAVSAVAATTADEADLDAAVADLVACCEPLKATVASADPTALPPGTVIVIIELVGLVIDWWKKRRQG